jgi:hypothetical protein
MILNLQKQESNLVSGGAGALENAYHFCFDRIGHWPFSNNLIKCMGSDRNTTVTCYDSDKKGARGWMAKDFECANWFCCSGDKGDYSYVSINNGDLVPCQKKEV